MTIFFKLKHWQLFLVWILGIIQLVVFMNTELWFLGFAIYLGLLFGWMYSIGKVLNENNVNAKRKLNIWSILYLISTVPFGIHFHNMFSGSYERPHPVIFIICGIAGLVSIINIGIIAAKSLKENESEGELTFGNYAPEFFLIVYMIIGVWIIQPRLNKIIREG